MTRTGPARRGRFARLCVAMMALAPAPASAQVFNFRQYTSVDGLPQVQVLALHQDRRGYLWLGTYGGLSRFDGEAFRTLTTRQGLNANVVRAIAEDAGGRLVVATGIGVCTVDGWEVDCREDIRHSGIQDVLPGRGDTLWIATETGVLLATDGGVRTLGVAQGLPAPLVNRLARDAGGGLWAATGAGLARWDGMRFVAVDPPLFAGHALRALMATRHGLVVTADHGVFVGGKGGFTRLDPLPAAAASALDAAVDSAGTLWIGTRAGAIRYDTTGAATLLTEHNGLASNLITRVLADREGNIWFGTEAGASKLVPGPFAHLTEAEGLPHGFVRAIVRADDGRLWVGTRDGLAVWQGDRFQSVSMGGLTDRRVYALAPLAAAEVLAGTRSGLLRIGGGGSTLYQQADGLPHNAVTALQRMPDGRVWIGTASGIVVFEQGRIRKPDVAGLDGVFVVSMAADDRGRLWIGRRAGGLLVYDGSKVTEVGPAQGMSEQAVWSIGCDAAGRMWVGTNGDGAYIFGPGSEHPAGRVTTADGLVNDFVWQVLPDSDGGVWLYTSQGLDRLTGTSFRHYGRGNGLIDLEGSASAALRDPDGTLWFGSGTGLVRYSPLLDVPSHSAPPVYIDELLAGTTPVSAARARIPAGAGVVTIRFSSPSFRDESGIRFRYRLLGATPSWSDATGDRAIRYAGLAPGGYEFQIVALNPETGRPSTPATLTFTVLPAFWQTWWFRGLAALALIAAAFATSRLRTRRLEVERRRLERVVDDRTRELAVNEQRLRDIVEHSTNLFYSHGADHVITYVSPHSRTFFECEPEEAQVRWTDFLTDHPANEAGRVATERALATGQKQPPYQIEVQGVKGRRIWVEVNEAPIVRDGRTVAIVGSLTDITVAKRAAEERERLETQLRSAQRMQAVGQLAGGIAHDFNNLLTAVVGNTVLIADTLGRDHPLADEVAEVRRAADRAAALVAQLLAFSRQQIVKPTTLDLNGVVTDGARMLRRLIGADIELRLDLAAGPLPIEADPTQLDQVLINLAVNARDAMPQGGTIHVTTARTRLLEPLTDEGGEEIAPADYIMLSVCDTGHGMDVETKSRAFEPFFTTKEVGKGTGLGLSTVYGIVKQNRWHIRVQTAPGAGASFRIFLQPASPTPQPAVAAPERVAQAPARRGQVVLVVEDERGVRDFVCRTLRRYGYRILEAPDGPTALQICERHEEPIHLLLSDMVMPGMTGKAVAEQVTARRAETRVLFMSGYTRDALGERGMLPQRTQLLQKPFTPTDLARRVEQVLA